MRAFVGTFTLAVSGIFAYCLYRGTLNYVRGRRGPETAAPGESGTEPR